jgi:hypothetical protein
LLGVLPIDRKVCLPGDPSAVDGEGCQSSGDCNYHSACVVELNTPGGYCTTIGCVEGDDTTCAPGGDGFCAVPENGETFCLDRCTTHSDCRQTDGYSCNTVGGEKMCTHPQPGSPCTQDEDCGNAPWLCLTGATYPGGYCSVDCTADSKCTDRSVCHDVGGRSYCIRSCDPMEPTSCRTGYACSPAGNGNGCL